MSLIISHNLSALNTQRNLQGSGESMAKSIEKLSSGYKINVGADDPSGLIISEQLRSQISGLERAVRNSSEAFNLIAIAEGALNEMNSILKKMRALAIHAANSGVTSPEQVSADQAEMDSGIETLNRIANTTRYSDQYLLNGQKQLVYDVTTVVNEPTDHSLLNTKMSRVDQVFKRDGVKMSIGFSGEKNQYQANTDTSAQRAYLEADNANSLCEIDGATVTTKQEFILTGTSGSRLFSFAEGAHIGTIVDNINNVRDSTGIGAALTFASDVRIDRTVNGTYNGSSPNYKPPTQNADPMTGFDDGSYVYQSGDVQIYGAGLNNVKTAKISSISFTPDAAASFKVGFNCDGDGKIYAKVVDKSTNSIEYYKDKDCTMLIGQGDAGFFAATNNSGIPSSPVQNLDGLFIKLNQDFARDLDVYEIAVVGQRLDNQKDMNVTGIQGWTDADNSVMSGINLGVNTDAEGAIFFDYVPVQMEADGQTVKSFEINVYKHPSKQPQFLVASSGVVENNVKIEYVDPATGKVTNDPATGKPQLAGQTVRVESVIMDDGNHSGLNITLNLPKKGALVGVTGRTPDEIKASDAYRQVMADLATAKSGYSQYQETYETAKKKREQAITDLRLAEDQLADAWTDEAMLRRAINRLEPEPIGDQVTAAEQDRKLANNAIISAARNAVLNANDTKLQDAFINIAKACTPPGAPEIIAEAIGNAVIDQIDTVIAGAGALANVPGAIANINWAGLKNGLLNPLRSASPLDTLTAAQKLTLATDIDTLFNAAYSAATNVDLTKDVGVKQVALQELEASETLYTAAKTALEAQANVDAFEDAIQNAVTVVGQTGGSAWDDILAADTKLLVTTIRDQLVAHMDTAVINDQTIDFDTYNWPMQKSDILDAIVNAYPGKYSVANTNNGTEDQIRALASDMYDSMVQHGDFANYGKAALESAKNPQPDLSRVDILTEIGSAIDGVIATAATTTQAVETALAAIPGTMDALKTEIEAALRAVLDAKLTAAPPLVPYTVADLTPTPPATISTIATAVVTAAGGTLAASIAGSNAADFNAFINDTIQSIYTSGSVTANSPVYDYIDKLSKYDTANDAKLAIYAPGGPATGTLATGAATSTAQAEALSYVERLELATDAGGGTTPYTGLADKMSDALAEQLLILAQEGIDIEDPAKLTADPLKSAIISGIIEKLPQNIKSDIGEATLKQYVTDVFTAYVTHQYPTGTALTGSTAGNPGSYSHYTDLVDTFADLDVQLHNGSIARNEARLERYLDRVEAAPLKVETGSATRKAWNNLVRDYPAGTDTFLTDLANKFGAYVRKTVQDQAETGGSASGIVWNDGSINDPARDVHDWLTNEMKAGEGKPVWDSIQLDLASADPDIVKRGQARQKDYEKLIDQMFNNVTKPDYNQDAAVAATPGEADSDYVYSSPVKKYFDQYAAVEDLKAELVANQEKKSTVDSAIDALLEDVDYFSTPKGDMVLTLHELTEDFARISIDADPYLEDIERLEAEAKFLLSGAGGGKGHMPKGNMAGSVSFTNLGMRIFAVDYGSAETIRIQNKAGNLFYQYREADTMEKIMVEPDTTVQVAGQDAQISLNGAPIFTTGLIANTTTPDFSGSLIFNEGRLGEATLAITGYDTGKLYSKATALQGVEEDESEISQLRRHFEPPALVVRMGDNSSKIDAGMLNKTGNPVSLYMDFSQIDSSVELKIDNLGQECKVLVSFTEPDTLTIDARSLSTDPDSEMVINVKVDPGNLKDGYYVTDPALKGLFIRTDDLVDINRSGASYTPPEAETVSTVPQAGDVMLEVSTYATNPRSNTSESMDNFIGGMQFQLGNTEGDQDRTVYSIQSMAMSELGRISYNGQEYCLQNVLGGGLASLTKDPILAMRVLAQAVSDVSTLRSRLGAFQSNMLQSNINALGVSVENITKTEAAIRDTDMAEQSTQFTRFQIMQQAGTSMLAQANQVSRNVLSLLQG